MRKSGLVLQCTVIGESLLTMVISCPFSVSTHNQQAQMKYRVHEIHINVDELTDHSWHFVHLIICSVNVNLDQPVKWSIELLSIEDSPVCYVPFPQQSVVCQITDSSKATINQELPLLGAGPKHAVDADRLRSLPDVLPHLIIFPLCCYASLLISNLNCLSCKLVQPHTGVLSPQEYLLNWHRDCISICDNW
jgi:hypothetical protein